MKNITESFEDVYVPVKALVINQNLKDHSKIYVEAYDFDRNGKPINARLLDSKEMEEVAQCLQKSGHSESAFLYPNRILSDQLLYIRQNANGFAIWYTPARRVNLLFRKELGIPSGSAYVPPIIWKADKGDLHVFALKTNKRPRPGDHLYHAPFFNISESGKVCMGTVNIELEENCGLENFIEQWENYFWNSYFSHLLSHTSPVNGNIVELWNNQIKTKCKFPSDILKKTSLTIEKLIV